MAISRLNSLRGLLALDAQVRQARLALQETSDLHPEFERRVQAVMELVERRDRAFRSEERPHKPAG